MGEPIRALVVEDSESDALLLVKELERGGYQVTAKRVDTVQAVTDALAKEPWNIIFSDYTMPHFRGTVALELLRENGLDIPFIFVSGTIGEETAAAAMKAGAHDYVVKGNLKRLVPAVQRELREAQVRQQRKRAEEQARQKQQRTQALLDVDPAMRAISEQLKPSLTAAIGYIVLLREGTFGTLTPLQEEVVEKLLTSSKELLDSVDRIFEKATRSEGPESRNGGPEEDS